MKGLKTVKNIFILMLLGLFPLLMGNATWDVQAADPTWSANYWNNKTLTGTPVLQREEAELNHEWATGSPAPGVVNRDDFSASWNRSVYFPGGIVRFTATMDDGMRVWVDDELLIDSWRDAAVRSITREISLGTGDHDIQVHYYEAGGEAVAKLVWTSVSNVPTPTTSWQGQYYNNTGLSGSPALVREDANIDFDWGVGSPAPGIGADNFSVRWTNSLSLQSGRYRFMATADDGVRLWVNGQLLVDEWHDAYEGTYTAEIDIPGGSASVEMIYYENVGGALARLQWVRIGSSGASSWRGEYYNNQFLSGSPALVQNHDAINFDWGSGSPAAGAIGVDNFSVRWTNSLAFDAARYRFTAVSDDGVRVWVNNQLIIDAWSDHAPTTYNGEIDLSGGTVPIRVEYYENTGGALVRLSWVQISSQPPTPPPVPIPPPDPGSATGVVVSPRLNVRTGPGLQYGVIDQLVQGQVVGLTGYRASQGWWVMIHWEGGTAWVSGHPGYLDLSVPHSSLTVWTGSPTGTGDNGGTGGPTGGDPTGTVVNCQYLNVRGGPGVSNGVVTTISAGTVVTLLGRNDASTWARIRLANGTVGWVNAYYLNESVPLNTLPVSG